MPKVLVVAFAMEPNRGGEPGLGWNFCAELARTQSVWAMTHIRHRAPIEQFLASNPPANPIHVTYVDLPFPLSLLGKFGYATYNLYYYLWQHVAARKARQLHREVGFDIAQHISFARWWMPSAAAALCSEGVKFVWGPLAGGESLASRFRDGIGLGNRITEFLRATARFIWTRDPFLKRTARSASIALASSAQTADRLRELGVARVELMPVSGLSIKREQFPARTGRTFRFISGGGLVYWKRFDLALRAFARAQLPDAEYVHVCGGAEQPRLEQLARELKIDHQVRFAGDLDYRQCVAELAQSDVLVHPVLRDSAGLVAEALTLGVPVITFDHLTPGYLVTEQSGIKLSIDDKTELAGLVDSMSAAMKKLHDDPAALERYRAGALKRAKDFEADARGKQMRQLHHSLGTVSDAVQNVPSGSPVQS